MKHLLLTLTVAASTVWADSKPYGDDMAFLKKHTDVIELKDGNAAIAVVPEYQGRVMTSTATGPNGVSYGWLNYPLIEQGVLSEENAKGRLESKIYVFGGEERFWLGPEGGQFGIFFAPGSKFDFDAWKTPAAIDTEPFDVVSSSGNEVVFTRSFTVTNHTGTRFDLKVDRTVRLLNRDAVESKLGLKLPEGSQSVAYETINQLTNTGPTAWSRDTGLLSIWLLGMYKPSPSTVMAIPFRKGADLGPTVNDAYFGKISADRLKVGDGVVFFKGDGESRGKIGIPPLRSLGVAGSYSPDLGSLTLVLYEPPTETLPYVNSMWELQKEPYSGDAINAYNDGSPAPGEPPLGPFYELETSSPAAALKPGESLTHRQTTVHFSGSAANLDPVATSKLGVSIEQITQAFRDE
jgi:hypothetical protein